MRPCYVGPLRLGNVQGVSMRNAEDLLKQEHSAWQRSTMPLGPSTMPVVWNLASRQPSQCRDLNDYQHHFEVFAVPDTMAY